MSCFLLVLVRIVLAGAQKLATQSSRMNGGSTGLAPVLSEKVLAHTHLEMITLPTGH
jgi:hypothetical protein